MNPEASERDYGGVSGSGCGAPGAPVHTLSVNSQVAVDSRGLVVKVNRPTVNGPAPRRVSRLCDYGVRPMRR